MTRTVLHVTECYGGGVKSMIERYVSAVPEARHVLLANHRRVGSLDIPEDVFSAVRELPANHVDAIRAVRATAQRFDADVVHAHSSFGGAYARLALGFDQRKKIVYTPHGLAFLHRNPLAPRSVALRAAEVVLSPLTGTFAACSSSEDRHVRRLNPFIPRVPVLNALLEKEVGEHRWNPDDSDPRPLVGIAARAVEQRDPLTFAAIARDVQEARFLWIGDGDPEIVEMLREAGVEVTGWADKDTVLGHISRMSVYLHTATYDGFPVSVLEAGAVGVPTIVSDIDAFAEVDPILRGKPDELSERLRWALRNSQAILNAWSPTLQRYSAHAMAASLRSLYGVTASSGSGTANDPR
ncbi:glycosyltransferase family 4 protein [Corynebacterium uterequi]|uniref:Glycosyltransferase n=1 Tax=Corynebacterium uterequi TaxID=1072256 RepID=A0A0G3HEW1_9CORY|nr:glycosyltransferase family 4 protein [Corynebacterium uterequi]AKK11891.1 glycosyltransferase [Corynebacterium uterequi]